MSNFIKNRKKKYFFSVLIFAFGLLLLNVCNENKDYDKGYDAAWDEEDEPSSFWSSQEEREGYEDGLFDRDMYDQGYEDAINHEKPEYYEDYFYKKGYKDGKRDR